MPGTIIRKHYQMVMVRILVIHNSEASLGEIKPKGLESMLENGHFS